MIFSILWYVNISKACSFLPVVSVTYRKGRWKHKILKIKVVILFWDHVWLGNFHFSECSSCLLQTSANFPIALTRFTHIAPNISEMIDSPSLVNFKRVILWVDLLSYIIRKNADRSNKNDTGHWFLTFFWPNFKYVEFHWFGTPFEMYKINN